VNYPLENRWASFGWRFSVLFQTVPGKAAQISGLSTSITWQDSLSVAFRLAACFEATHSQHLNRCVTFPQ
jgi:hypothetical protein